MKLRSREEFLNESNSYNDYPKQAIENAKKALRWRDEHPDEIVGGTQIGWTRVNQIAKNEKLSLNTIKRIWSFKRHIKNSEISDDKKGKPWTDAGYVAWLLWGGSEMIEWAGRKIKQLENTSNSLKESVKLSDYQDVYKKGSYSKVFINKNDDNQIIKIGKDVIKQALLFKEHPDCCPFVYEINEEESFVVLERLNDETSQKDFDEYINKERGYIHNWGYNTFKNDKSYLDLKSKLTTKKGLEMLERVRYIILTIHMEDIHSRNFGYDKNGILKALDI